MRGGSTVWDATDPYCEKYVQGFLLSDVKRVGESVIAGVRSIEFTGARADGEQHWVWLAPTLGCTQMKAITYNHNSFGLPTSYSRLEAIFV